MPSRGHSTSAGSAPLPPVVFHILLSLGEGERHGYALKREIALRTAGKMKLGPGVLYGSINKMLEQGLIEESDERPDAHLDDERRRYYRITPYGRKVAQAEVGANARTGPFGRRKIRGPAPCLMPGYQSSCIAGASRALSRRLSRKLRWVDGAPVSGWEMSESRGWFALATLWIRILRDLAISVPAQFAREIRQDGRHALRLWSRRPLHTGFAISALAIGIGANTGVFSVVNALLLRSLPFRDPDRLIATHSFLPSNQDEKQFHDWAKQSTYLEDAAITYNGDVNLGGTRESARAHLTETSWNFFTLLGARTLGPHPLDWPHRSPGGYAR